MHLRSLFFSLLIAVLAGPVFATPQIRNGTDLWLNPSESGWGLNVFHQGDTLFASLFVYGADGQPRWYTASSLVGGDDGPLHDRPTTYTGALFESTGPAFNVPFEPNTVTRRQVGTMTIDLGNNLSIVSYTIDGVSVTKQVTPFTFRASDLRGTYVGWLYQPANGSTPEFTDEVKWTIFDSGSGLRVAESSDRLGSCTYDGTPTQNGQISLVSGTYGNPCGGRSGPFGMTVDLTPDGFTGFFTGNRVNANQGRVAMSARYPGTRDGTGWRSDLWFVPNESGWGVNVVEQGDTIFAALFVYDAQRRPHWYAASALARSGSSTTSNFSGPLYESTGPYFGTAFNPAAVVRRQVGTMSFAVNANGTAALNYTVDGVAVSKTVSRFAFRRNDLSGTYLGHLISMPDDAGGSSYEAMTIAIQDNDGGFQMQTTPIGATQFNSGANCTYTAPGAAQAGEQRSVSGTYACAGGRTGNFTMNNVFGTFNGFTSTFQGAWVANGHMEGVRQGAN
jgi:hypothetical protein